MHSEPLINLDDMSMSLDEAYYMALWRLYKFGKHVPGSVDISSVGSGFGKNNRGGTYELIADTFTITSPLTVLLGNPNRNASSTFAIAQALWILSGSAAADMISPFNDRANDMAQSDGHLWGAYGQRLLLDRIYQLKQRRSIDSTTRRNYMNIYDADLDINHLIDGEPIKDIPCTIGYHFLIRKNELTTICNMRAQSAAMVMPYDLTFSLILHRLMANEFRVAVGPYIHQSNSIHFYESELPVVQKVLQNSSAESSRSWSPTCFEKPCFNRFTLTTAHKFLSSRWLYFIRLVNEIKAGKSPVELEQTFRQFDMDNLTFGATINIGLRDLAIFSYLFGFCLTHFDSAGKNLVMDDWIRSTSNMLKERINKYDDANK